MKRAVRGPDLKVLVMLCVAASLLHFTHNAEYLHDYPNLPAWLSRGGVYLAWCAVTLVGVAGWALLRSGQRVAGLVLLALYACLGFDGLLHYRLAPFLQHSAAMNFTILAEVAASALLLAGVLRVALAAPRRRHA
jgi:hypothetical protein